MPVAAKAIVMAHRTGLSVFGLSVICLSPLLDLVNTALVYAVSTPGGGAMLTLFTFLPIEGLFGSEVAERRGFRDTMRPVQGGLYGDSGGPPAATGNKPRQARKGATVVTASGAGVWLPGLPPNSYVQTGSGQIHGISSSRTEVAAKHLSGNGWPATCTARPRQRAE